MSSSTPNIGLTLPVGGEKVSRQIINENNTKIDTYAGEVNTGLDGLRDGIAIVADGDTHAAITSGQFVYVKNHQTLSEGLYTASTNIAANAALSGSNLTADPKGGLNTLSEQIGNLSMYNANGKDLESVVDSNTNGMPLFGFYNSSSQNIPESNTGVFIALQRSTDEKWIIAFTASKKMYLKIKYGTWQAWVQLSV